MNATSGQRAGLSPEEKRDFLAELIGQSSRDVGLCPLSLAQQRLWFLEQLQPGTAVHNLPSGLRLTGELDFQALRRAVSDIVSRHETLRTAFISSGGEVFQKISPATHVEIPIVDLRTLPENVREREAYNIACDEARRPFNLQYSPLVRLSLIRMRDEYHILLFTMHHLVSDGWSIGVFIEELIQFYEAHIERRECQLPQLSIQYADYACWQRESLAESELDRQIRYWKTRLAGIPPLLELPTDRMRPAQQSFSGGALSILLPSLLVEGLKALAQRDETTLFTVLLAALNILLYRYSNQEDICIGVPVAGRSFVETETMIGLFVNTLVIRTGMCGNPPFRDILAQVRDVSLEASTNQDLPFEKVVEELQPTRNLAYSPLFQVMMTALKDPLCNRHFATLMATPYVVGTLTSRVDLTALLIEAADGAVWWRIEYNTTLFDQARIQRMIGHYQMLLNSILKNPESRIGDLTLLTSEEDSEFSAWNSTVTKYPKACVHTLITDQVARSPDSIAVVFGDRQLTYGELHRQAMQVGAALRAAGVHPGSRVAICLERSLEMLAGVLGVLYTGAAYVPLDPAYPPERLSFMMEDAEVALVLTQRELMVRLSQNAVRRVLIEDALTMAPGGVPESDPEPQDPESLAYVIFTSGSTGRPKGVCVPHRALVNLLNSMQFEPGLTANDRFLAVTNLCFDISALELFLPLITGARFVIASREAVVDGSKLLENLRRHAITAMQATPSTWRLLIESGWNRAACELRVLCGGEALPVDLANQLLERSDSVWNLYGPTETTIWSSLSFVRKQCPITIGRPIQNTRFYVLDRCMRRVPVGTPGELYIGGDGLANGYANRPELTSARFVPDPFDSSGRKLYKTGDEVRYCTDGAIEYLGRLDLQVKIRGFRIELGEIETVAAQHPGVEQAAAIVREYTPGDKRLVCYVVPEPNARVSAAELRATLKFRLPDYMVPAVVILDSLPLTANGKIDRVKLSAPAEERRARVRPPNALEKRLLPIWKHVLRLNEIGIRDNFFDLGGHSLLSMQLLAEIERVFGRRLPVSTVFQAQTVEDMAAVLEQYSSEPWSSLVPIQPHGLRPPLFLIPGASGSVLEYADLASLLDSDQPLYGLQYVGLDDGKPLERIEAIAEHFIREIRKVQPCGPYRLAGFCVGGLVAFEMAKQLVACGEEVPLLALIETWPPSFIPKFQAAPAAVRPLIFLIRGMCRHFGATLSLPPRQAFLYFRQKSTIIKEMVLHRDIYRGNRFKRFGSQVWEAMYRAGSRYVPTPFTGCILLFRLDNRDIESDADAKLGWSELAGEGCLLVRITGEDRSDVLKKPYVQALADNLTQRLRDSQAQVVERVL